MDRRRLTRRDFLHLGGIGAGAALLGACAAPAPQVVEKVVTQVVEKVVTPTAAPAPNPSDLAADLKVWVWHDNEVQIELIKPLFNTRFPNIKVEPQLLEFGDLHTKLYTSLAAGSGAPDISYVELSQLGKFAYYGSKTGLMDLMPLLDRDGFAREDFLEWAFDNCMDKDRKQLCVMPRAVCPAGTFYRRDLFEAAGLPSSPEEVGKLLKDWPSWFEAGKQIADPAIERAFMINAESHGPVFSQLGGANYFDANGELRIGKDPELTELLNWHLKARQAGIDTIEIKDEWGPEGQTALKDGMIATDMIGVWWNTFLKAFATGTDGKWGIVNIAAVKGANGGGDNCVIPTQGTQKDAAWEFVKFICTDQEAQRMILAVGSIIPSALKSFYALPDFNRPDAFFGGQAIAQLANEVLLQMPPLVLNPNDPIAAASLSKYVGQCVRENGDPEAAMTAAREEILNQMQS